MTDKPVPYSFLDCTLRDGGYVNNWEFDTETSLDISQSLYRAGIRYIELGLMGRGGAPGKSTKFSDFADIEPLLAGRKSDCRYAVMLTQTEYAAMGIDVPPRGERTPDLIRLAYFKPEADEAMKTARLLMEKGYIVFLQAMATFMYTDGELAEHIETVNRTRPYAFYMVDSFSTMYRDDVIRMEQFVLRRLDRGILFGFHAHNNIQMAFSNVIAFLEHGDGRTLFVDGSIYGMGRGAGNVPMELLLEYANKKLDGRYDEKELMRVFARRMEPIFKKYFWGYSFPYLLTASKEMNSVYGWYLMSRGVTGLDELDRALDLIPAELRYTLSRSAADEAIKHAAEGKKDD